MDPEIRWLFDSVNTAIETATPLDGQVCKILAVNNIATIRMQGIDKEATLLHEVCQKVDAKLDVIALLSYA